MSKIKFSLSALLLASVASASVVLDNQDSISQRLEAIDSKRGIEIGGTVRSYLLHSQFSSSQDGDGLDISPDYERGEFTQADLRLGFRPWQATRANVVIRMGAGMQDYFIAASKSVSMPWMNIDGHIGSDFYWVVGDFRQQYTPLTLWSPDLEFLYEPEVFRRNREMARQQVFLQGNQRNLQGANIQYRHDFGDLMGELRVESIFSRLRKVENLDLTGATGNLVPNSGLQGSTQAASMDKYMMALNLESMPLNKNLLFGVTYMNVWDDESSLAREWRINKLYCDNVEASDFACAVNESNRAAYYTYGPINPWDTLPQNTAITSLRAGFDVGGIMKSESMIFDMTAEYAMSKDDVYREWAVYDTTPSGDFVLLTLPSDFTGAAYDTSRTKFNQKSALDGSALLAQVTMGFQSKDKWISKVGIDYLMNDSGWFNNMAQSPSFYPRRIANIDKDGNTSAYGVKSPLYSTFDAMYHFTPKFSPVNQTLANDDNAFIDGQAESYNTAAFAKNSWTTSTFTRKELELISQLTDPTVQLALPNGLATSNRAGLRANLVAGYGKDNLVETQVLFSSLAETKATAGTDKATFSELGYGVKVDVLKIFGGEKPFEISGSLRNAKRVQGDAELTTAFLNAGIHMQYFKRFGITAGFQKADMELNTLQSLISSAILPGSMPLVKGEQTQWLAGLDYTISKNAWLALNFGQINVSNSYQSAAPLTDTDGDLLLDATNLPTYIRLQSDSTYSYLNATSLVHEFTQNLIDCSVNVDF